MKTKTRGGGRKEMVEMRVDKVKFCRDELIGKDGTTGRKIDLEIEAKGDVRERGDEEREEGREINGIETKRGRKWEIDRTWERNRELERGSGREMRRER